MPRANLRFPRLPLWSTTRASFWAVSCSLRASGSPVLRWGCWLELLGEISCCKFTGRGGPEPSFIRTLTFAIRISNSSSSSPYRLCWRFPSYLPTTGLSAGSAHILPQLYSEGRFEELNQTLNATLKGVILLLLPVSALAIAQKMPLVYLVFSHTRMHAADLHATAATLGMFSIGMFAWGAQNILSRGFYAARDTLTPAIAGTAMTFLNLPVYWILSRHLQHLGLALASSIGVIAYTAILFTLLSRRTHNAGGRKLLEFFLKVCVASGLGAWVCYEVMKQLELRIPWRSAHGALEVLIVASTAGLLLTALVAKLLRVRELEPYLKRLKLG